MNKIKKQQPCINLFVATSKSGKSHLIQYLIKYFTLKDNFYEFGLVLTTTKYNKEYSFLPANAVQVFSQELLINYIRELEKKQEELPKGERLPHSFLILDDCLSAVKKTSDFVNLIATIRHLNVSTFITTQRLTAGPVSSTLVRDQTEVMFAFGTSNKKNIEILYTEFGAEIFDNFEEFAVRFKQATRERYTAMLFIKNNEMLDKKKNFIPFRAPADIPDVQIQY